VTHRRKHLRYLLGEVFESDGFNESMHSFPAISAHVTAYARLYLWQLMEKCGTGNYFYCDTDSLFVNDKGLGNLAEYMDFTALGKLKLENRVERITIYGLKDYILDGKTVIKGIRKNAVQVSPTEFIQDRWPTLKGMLSRQETDHYVTAKTHKHLERDYTKGTVTDNGWIEPLRLDGFLEPS